MSDARDHELSESERIDKEFELAFEAQRVARTAHHAASLLEFGDEDDFEWLLQQPDHSASFDENVREAREWYAHAESHYLRAASLHFNREPLPTASAQQLLEQLPSPLRDELTALRQDYHRARDASPNATDRLERSAEYLSNLEERVGNSLGVQRDDQNRGR